MPAGTRTLLSYLRGLVRPSEPDGPTDAALLGRFLADRDEEAFTAIVNRHGPLVLHVCHRVLGDAHAAEDAFQAVFLVLARKAATVHPRERLTAWLHGVARRVALKARSDRARHAMLPSPHTADPRPDPLAELSVRELLAVIDEELQRLPESYRLPVILCCLEGRSLEEAARQLGWTTGSVKGRLERGRARLHHRLVRRGLTLSAALSAAELARGEVAATVGLLTYAASAASDRAVELAAAVIQGMAVARWKYAAAVGLVSILLAAGVLSHRMANTPTRPIAPGELSASAGRHIDPPAPGEINPRIEVNGRVLDPGGNPLAGARLYVGYSIRRYVRGMQTQRSAYPLRATSGPDGRFSFAFAWSELDARWLDDWRPAVVAVAGNYGPDWAEVGLSGRGADLTLKLVEDRPVDGRIVDPAGKPLAGAKVEVVDITRDSEDRISRWLGGKPDLNAWSARSWKGAFPERDPGAKTDRDGRFRLAGLGRDRVVQLVYEAAGFSLSQFGAVTRPPAATPYIGTIYGTPFEHVARPPRRIRGVVRERTTGAPVPGVKMSTQWNLPTAVTGADGSYELVGCPVLPSYVVLAEPQAGQPYFRASRRLTAEPGAESLEADLELAGGVRLRGRVTDRGTGKPPATALVEYYPLYPNPHSSRMTNGARAASATSVRADGQFSLVVLPGPGVVCVTASPRHLYAAAAVEDDEWPDACKAVGDFAAHRSPQTAVGDGGQGILCVSRYNALSVINPDERAESLALDLAVRSGRPVQGKVVGPDGKPMAGVRVQGLTEYPDEETLDSSSFTVMGLNPRRGRDLVFYHEGARLGKVLTVTGEEPEPLVVQLEGSGSVLGRVVRKNGKPGSGVTFVLSPDDQSPRVNVQTDQSGRFRATLKPGVRYRAHFPNSGRLRVDAVELKADSGKCLDVGDLLMPD